MASLDPWEVLATTSADGLPANITLWDPHSGAQLRTWKGGATTKGTLTSLGGQYWLSAAADSDGKGKALINAWRIDRREQLQTKTLAPGPVNALCACPSGSLLAAACGRNLHVWLVRRKMQRA